MVEKAIRILVIVKRTFVSRDLGLWKDLCVSLVRLRLDCALQAWNFHLERGIDRIEGVERRDTRNLFGFENFKYEKRLKIFILTTLKDRQVDDLILPNNIATSPYLNSLKSAIDKQFKRFDYYSF